MDRTCVECHKNIDDKLYTVNAVLKTPSGERYTRLTAFLCSDTYKKIEKNLKKTYSGELGFIISGNGIKKFLDHDIAHKKLPNSLGKLLNKPTWVIPGTETEVDAKQAYNDILLKLYAV